MRVLLVCRDAFVRTLCTNPYVSSLVQGLEAEGCDVNCSLVDFWYAYDKYDLLFFQWPEEIFQWNVLQIDLGRLSKQFDTIRHAGVKTVITCHNLYPHNHNKRTTELYELVYSKVDAIHHLGKYSYELMKERFPQKYHFIAPHHIADSLWSNTPNSKDGKHILRIPSDSIVISSFGEFRNNDEKDLFFLIVKKCKSNSKRIVFLAPRLYAGRLYNGRWINKTFIHICKSLVFKYYGIRCSGYLSDEELRLWLSATDIVFIQRKSILNSGNIPLAYSAGKVVVGPDVGNVGVILRETGNYAFNPTSDDSLEGSMSQAIEAIESNQEVGMHNYCYAKSNWTVPIICRMIRIHLDYICGGVPHKRYSN